MKNHLKNMISQDGQVSTVRIMSLACCLTAIIVAIAGICRHTPDYLGLSELCGTFLSIAFAGKVAQKHIETSAK